jgi:hypothetical protein
MPGWLTTGITESWRLSKLSWLPATALGGHHNEGRPARTELYSVSDRRVRQTGQLPFHAARFGTARVLTASREGTMGDCEPDRLLSPVPR